MHEKKEKTGWSERATAVFITSAVLGVVPFFGIDVDTLQATNLGLCSAAAIGWGLRQYHKAKSNG